MVLIQRERTFADLRAVRNLMRPPVPPHGDAVGIVQQGPLGLAVLLHDPDRQPLALPGLVFQEDAGLDHVRLGMCGDCPQAGHSTMVA